MSIISLIIAPHIAVKSAGGHHGHSHSELKIKSDKQIEIVLDTTDTARKVVISK